MDTRIHIPYHRRILSLRLAIRYSRTRFARLLGVALKSIELLEKGEMRLDLPSIIRLRLMEKAFQEYLDEYYRLCKKFHCVWTWGKEEKVYGKWDGRVYTKKMVVYRSSHILPSRQEDIEALGGLEAFGVNPISTERRKRGRPKLHRGSEDEAQTDSERGTPKRSKLGSDDRVRTG